MDLPRRKIRPYEVPAHPGDEATTAALATYAADKADALNQHVIGYGDLAEREWAALGLVAPDMDAARRYRLARIRERLQGADLAGILLYDPLNVRYATDSTNMQLWCTHNAVRYALVMADGPLILWDFHNCEHLSGHLDEIDEIRHGETWIYHLAGERAQEHASAWAVELEEVVRRHGGGNRRLASDRLDGEGRDALAHLGIDVVPGEPLMERARAVKSIDEIAAMRRAIAACEAAMGVMEAALRPGMTENDLWSILHAENIRRGGEWIETRLLASGPRTNPWFQECSARTIEAGDLVAFDTDLIGPYGFCCDISRTWLAGPGAPSAEQRSLYAISRDQIETNVALLRPGISFRDLCTSARTLPADCLPNRYNVMFHGVGLCDEYPSVPYPDDWAHVGYDGTLEAGMVIAVESYVGRHAGHEGVKLEQQVLITASGHEILSTYPFDRRLGGA